MRINKYFVVSILVLVGSFMDLRAQTINYLVEDKGLATQISESVISRQGDLDAMQKSWGKLIIDEAFKEYFSKALPTSVIYDETFVGQFQKQINELNDQKNEANAKLAKKEAEYSKLKADYEAKLAELGRKHEVAIKEVQAERDNLKVQVSLRDATIDANKARIASLEQEAAIARRVKAKHAEKLQKVELLYHQYINSSLEYVDVKEIVYAVKDYEDYVALVELTIASDAKQKIDCLNNLASVAAFYHDAIAFMDSKFDQTRYNTLLKQYSELTSNTAALKDMQKTECAHVGTALRELQGALSHFNTNVLVYLEEQGLMPSDSRVATVRSDVDFQIALYTDEKYPSATNPDRYTYNPYYTKLNSVLDWAYNNLRKMTIDQYEEYISEIKTNL